MRCPYCGRLTRHRAITTDDREDGVVIRTYRCRNCHRDFHTEERPIHPAPVAAERPA